MSKTRPTTMTLALSEPLDAGHGEPQPQAGAPGPQRPLPAGAAMGGYTVVEVLGQGAFGVTYLARDQALQKLVAVKEYLPAEFALRLADETVAPRDPGTADRFDWGLRRFLDEARTLARLEHPNIVKIITYFEQRATACFAMEYERGESLKALLARRSVLAQEELLALALPLLDGLEKVHQAEYIHRDVKPSNILIRLDGTPVLIDFGSSRRSLAPGWGEHTAVLTPGYAPQEQYAGSEKHQGPWTDVYAFAGVLYRAVAGRPPVDVSQRTNAAIAGDSDPLTPASVAAAGDYSPDLLAAIDVGLALAPKDRPQSAGAMRALLAEAAPGRPTTSVAGAVVAPAGEERTELTAFMRQPGGGFAAGSVQSVLVAAELSTVGNRDLKAAAALQPARNVLVTSGEQALRHLDRFAVDLCILDADLADMTGLELLERVMADPARRDMPVLMAADNRGADHLLRAVAAGAAGYMRRPYTAEEFQRKAAELQELASYTEVEEALLAQARAALTSGDAAGAARLLEDFLEAEEEARTLEDTSDRLPYDQGMTALARGDADAAMLAFKQGARALGLLAAAWDGLARARGALHDREGKRKAADRAAGAEERIRELEREKQMFINGRRENDSRKNPFNLLGLAQRTGGDYTGAERSYRMALELSPEDPAILCNMALVLALQGRRDEALDSLELSLARRPGLEPALRLRSKLLGDGS